MLFLPIITIFLQKSDVTIIFMENSFENPIDTSTYSPISQHVNRKRYLMSFLPIITMIFQQIEVAITLMG